MRILLFSDIAPVHKFFLKGKLVPNLKFESTLGDDAQSLFTPPILLARKLTWAFIQFEPWFGFFSLCLDLTCLGNFGLAQVHKFTNAWSWIEGHSILRFGASNAWYLMRFDICVFTFKFMIFIYFNNYILITKIFISLFTLNLDKLIALIPRKKKYY